MGSSVQFPLHRSDWIGQYREISESNKFDATCYIKNYPDVSASGMGPLEHYVRFGKGLGRDARGADPSRDIQRPRGRQADHTVQVSVICLTYNHEAYIAKTIEGFLAQSDKYSIEFLVADDCSQDNTAAIVAEYARRDPRIIPILRQKNLGPADNFVDTANRVRGLYVAMCEGDDYWTDPLKIEKQVDFLEERPEYAVCFHPVLIIDDLRPDDTRVFPNSLGPFELWDLVDHNFIQTNSVMYRWRFPEGIDESYERHAVPGDWHLHLLHAELGRIGFLNETMGVYRRHPDSMWAKSTQFSHRQKFASGEMTLFRDLKQHFGGYYNAIFTAKERSIFLQIVEHCLANHQTLELFEFLRRNLESAAAFLSDLSFDFSKVDMSDSASLWASLARQKTVSVVILTYNHAGTIRQCLQSVLAQKGCFEMEIIVGDDGSLDDTVVLARNAVQEHSGTIRIFQTDSNSGFLTNLKRSLARCTGDYIAFCEGDDYWISTKKIAKQLLFVDADPKIAMCFNWLLLDYETSGRVIPHPDQGKIAASFVTMSELIATPLTANFSCCFYRAEAVRSIPAEYYKTPGAADWLFNLYIAQIGKVGFLPEILSVYRIHEKGLWASLSPEDQDRRIQEARTHILKVFLPDMTLAQTKTLATITETTAAPSLGFWAWLDQPNEANPIVFVNNMFLLKGWALHKQGKYVQICVRRDGRDQLLEIEEKRDDVIKALRVLGSQYYLRPRCGFEHWIEFEGADEEIEIGLAAGDDIFWWCKIEMSMQDSNDGRAKAVG